MYLISACHSRDMITTRCWSMLLSLLATLTCGMAADVPVGTTPAQLGSAAFYPSPEHPVGDMGDGTGRYPGAANPCLEWQEHAATPAPDMNILWETRLKGWTQSHPIVVGNKLITLEEPNFVVCLDATSGKLLWRTECDHLLLLPPKEQPKARAVIKRLTDLFFEEQILAREYAWLTGILNDGFSPGTGMWNYIMPGMRQRKGAIDDTQATKDRIVAIEKEWSQAGYDGTPAYPPSGGHGMIPFDDSAEKMNKDTHKYDELSQQLTDCRLDYGVCPDLYTITIQPETSGQTQDTPTSDGTNIYATFGYGQTACLDLSGRVKWMKWFQEDIDKASLLAAFKRSHYYGYLASKLGYMVRSPSLVDDKLIVTQGCAIRALDKNTGDLIWTVKYKHEYEWPTEGRVSDRGPVAMTLKDGVKVLICPQGYVIRISDGKVLCDDAPLNMFDVPFGSNHACIMGVVTGGDVCYYTWALGAGAVRFVAFGRDKVLPLYMWQTAIPGMIQAGSIGGELGVPRGSQGSETNIVGAPVYDPDRKRIYVSTHVNKSLYAFDAVDGHIIDQVTMNDYQKQAWFPQKIPLGTVGSPYLSCSGSNELTDPMLVGGKFIYMPDDMGDCYVMDADDIHKVIAENNVMIQFHRDLALWKKPWSDIGRQIADHYLYSGADLFPANDMHRAPGDPFINGDKTYLRTLEGMTCISATSATAPVINDAEASGTPAP
jgi:outer membrane protein assembly factor BamB